MSKAAKNLETANAAASVPAPYLSFEEALQRLESIVVMMESEELPLENLLLRFEEGTRLAQICQKQLAAAEVKIQQLEKNAAGEFSLKPFEPAE